VTLSSTTSNRGGHLSLRHTFREGLANRLIASNPGSLARLVSAAEPAFERP
jgi:hypothetical protein